MFENVPTAPPDAIFGLNDLMARDPRSGKINLGAGVYKDEHGKTPVMEAVQEAEGRLLRAQSSKSYLPIEGSADYDRGVAELLLGAEHRRWQAGDGVVVQTPGGTGALRVAADFVAQHVHPKATVWISAPTWPNHAKVFGAAGLAVKTYRYFDAARHGLGFDAMLEDLSQAAAGDLVVLHACCHNPTGVDPTAAQQTAINELLLEKRLVPLLDFAYQGFAAGVEDDAMWLRRLTEQLPETIVASSFSKNFGLYNERTGALTLFAESPKVSAAVLSQIKQVVRANYSNPPNHGAAVVTTVLSDADLRQTWRAELSQMRLRIQSMRQRFTAGLDARGVRLHADGNGFIAEQNGMFSYSGLTTPQVHALRDRFAVYAMDSGRINVAGMTESNIDPLCDAVAAVLREG